MLDLINDGAGDDDNDEEGNDNDGGVGLDESDSPKIFAIPQSTERAFRMK